MERISKSSVSEFLSRRPFSIVHIDAEWDGYRKSVTDKIASIETQFEQEVSFGYVDCDREQVYADEIGIISVPSIAYYRGASLIAVVIGVRQDVAKNLERMKNGQPLDQTNTFSRG